MFSEKKSNSVVTLVGIVFSFFVFGSLFAQNAAPQQKKESLKTSNLLSPNCDEEKIKGLAGNALKKIGPAKWNGEAKGFEITLDTSTLTFAQLTQKMQEAGCF